MTCCTIGCDCPAVYLGYYEGREFHDNYTLLCRRCALEEEWPAAWLHLLDAEQSLAEMGLQP